MHCFKFILQIARCNVILIYRSSCMVLFYIVKKQFFTLHCKVEPSTGKTRISSNSIARYSSYRAKCPIEFPYTHTKSQSNFTRDSALHTANRNS